MIISSDKRLVWLMTPKCASRSMTDYLKRCIPDAKDHGGPHWSDIPAEAAGYAVGACVRNPYSRVYSAWKFLFPNPAARPPFDKFVVNVSKKIAGPMGQTQAAFLSGKTVTYLVKFEDLPGGLSTVPPLAGCQTQFPHANASTSSSDEWLGAYTQQVADVVYQEFAADFTSYGYDRNSWQAIPNSPVVKEVAPKLAATFRPTQAPRKTQPRKSGCGCKGSARPAAPETPPQPG